ncbi:Nif3-like dinuclear metal center hexameric protein [methane-oxidizing endosymbiont of Gigantopelta aegis]|uniref:Nif3-like dinuclear metal center hexameric protein n=1 Tax=methane-oxidizing endosymbiont of Gigantopelta aegis TaxID=2794938 RepID=UPI0018DE9489|nr:Nif3-like dinuclear metal center hexameric protein [methane-oxidizing endosymbiont of Gigantopelta aegis]
MITRTELEAFFATVLHPEQYPDYGPNGLQVEGTDHIETIAFAVSATRASILQAKEHNADALVVHHGLFWSFHGAKPITGVFGQRIIPLIKNNINLFGYHLPLDGHADIGNAAVLGHLLNCEQQQPFGDYKGVSTGIKGVLKTPVTALTLAERLETVVRHPVMMATTDKHRLVNTVGIITGGANSEWKTAVEANLDVFITGEMSEHDWHDSQEHGITMLAAGHNATEQFGIKALMEETQNQLDVECFFIRSENPA